MSLVWSLAYGAFFWRRGRLIALLLAFAVFSHFLLDLPMHPKDLALWPQSAIHVGFGLWNRLPIGWWWIELVIVLAACAYYAARARRLKTFGGHVLWASAVILLLHVLNAPWWKH
jgi:membrane-bound metal-dependent hydrolase YbcI (DUF457 family)